MFRCSAWEGVSLVPEDRDAWFCETQQSHTGLMVT